MTKSRDLNDIECGDCETERGRGRRMWSGDGRSNHDKDDISGVDMDEIEIGW